jgi:hypothetical protein
MCSFFFGGGGRGMQTKIKIALFDFGYEFGNKLSPYLILICFMRVVYFLFNLLHSLIVACTYSPDL